MNGFKAKIRCVLFFEFFYRAKRVLKYDYFAIFFSSQEKAKCSLLWQQRSCIACTCVIYSESLMMTHMNAERHQWINMFVNGSIKLVWGQRFHRCATKINQLARNAYCMCSIVNYVRSFEMNTCRQKVYNHHQHILV